MSAFTVPGSITFADMSGLRGRIAPYYERVAFVGRGNRYMIRRLPRWQRWRERRGVARWLVRGAP